MNKWFILVLIFIFSLSLRLWGLNNMGRTWDEPEFVKQGYKMIELLRKGDFTNKFFYETYDHPPLTKYIYGITAHFDADSYDYTFSRALSAIVSSLSVVIVVLIGWQFISRFVGIASGVILAMMPFFLGFSQLVSTESMTMFFFTLSVYSFMSFLQKVSFKKLILTGVLTGLALQVKQSNGLLFPLFILMYIIWYLDIRSVRQIGFFNQRILSIFYIFVISITVLSILWPASFFYLKEILAIHNKFWGVKTSPPEIFFGKLMLTPEIYYPIMFAITTPLLILILFLVGLKRIDVKKRWIFYVMAIWFFLPFIQSFYPWRQHGVRYIIQIYAPLSLIAAIGLDFILSKFTKRDVAKLIYSLPLLFYLFVTLLRMTPYYLDYFNIVVGGAKGVYDKKLFQLGWWGQGLREAGIYVIKHAKVGSKVGLAVSPIHSVPPMPNMLVGKYKEGETYNYIIVNYYNILREGFDDNNIKRKYRPVYFVKADGAILGTVYKRK